MQASPRNGLSSSWTVSEQVVLFEGAAVLRPPQRMELCWASRVCVGALVGVAVPASRQNADTRIVFCQLRVPCKAKLEAMGVSPPQA